jgi:hypothetical protein
LLSAIAARTGGNIARFIAVLIDVDRLRAEGARESEGGSGCSWSSRRWVRSAPGRRDPLREPGGREGPRAKSAADLVGMKILDIVTFEPASGD